MIPPINSESLNLSGPKCLLCMYKFSAFSRESVPELEGLLDQNTEYFSLVELVLLFV
jgi:hypothetical protein